MAPLNLAQLRFDAGLTPEELGDKVGVSGRTIRRLEMGLNRPTPRVAVAIAEHFDVKPSDLWPLELAA